MPTSSFTISLYEGNELSAPVLMPPVWPPELNNVDFGLCKAIHRLEYVVCNQFSYAKNPDSLACCLSNSVGSSFLMLAMPDNCT